MSDPNHASAYYGLESLSDTALPLPTPAMGSDRDFLTMLLASAPIAIVMVNAQGEILYTNAKLCEMFGYGATELIGLPIEQLIPERFHGDHRAHRDNFARHPHVRVMGSGLDLAGRRKDGSEFPIEAGLSYLFLGSNGVRSEDGAHEGLPRTPGEMLVVSSITDITRRKQTEELLEHRVAERTREIERRRQVSDGLRDILTVLNSNLPLEDILNHIASQACRLLQADASVICRASEDPGPLIVQASYGLVDNTAVQDSESEPRRAWESIPLQITMAATSMRLSSALALPPDDDVVTPLETTYQAVLTVPLVIKDEAYGSLMLYYRAPRRFSAEEIELANTLGDQTALAIENARLRTQVERTAVAAERSRIARDLHDSVTQTLFSASIIAEVLPKLWRRSQDDAMFRLDELRQLTRGALAEMRTLLLELRPATLIEVELSELLRQLTEAITGRARVPIDLVIESALPLPPDVKVAFYHVAQEALNNVAKHSRATHVTLTLNCQVDHALLSVRDNGRGFVIEKVTPEHLGLTIMHERSEAIGARLQVYSQIDGGTEITIQWPAA
jgi:PAS domain S-box-containing protein